MQFIKNGPDIPERLLQEHEEGKVVLFCGAGISFSAGLPDFKNLVEGLYEDFNLTSGSIQKKALRKGQYDIAVNLLENNVQGGRGAVREKLAEKLKPDLDRRNATKTHEALLTLARSRKGETRLITTNFDRLFETVIDKGSGKYASIRRCEAPLLPVPKSRWQGLTYLHGLLPKNPSPTNMDHLVISSGDFGLAYLNERWASRFVSELFRNYTICFVGYSISDPVLRYMMDALAADRLLGEHSPEMYAFHSYPKGKEEEVRKEWEAKNVTPILYKEHNRHQHLHKTLWKWADDHRDGALSKKQIVAAYAGLQPGQSTKQDDYVGRMLWALSDKEGLPAKRFAEHNPAPSLDWLEHIGKEIFESKDLSRFGVIPDSAPDPNLSFSLISRPAHYSLTPRMSLAGWPFECTQWDKRMGYLAQWLVRHLNNPELLLWVVNQGGRLHDEFTKMIKENLSRITSTPMRKLWQLAIIGRLRSLVVASDFRYWSRRLRNEGLTTALRLDFKRTLIPIAMINPHFPEHEETQNIEDKGDQKVSDLVYWGIQLSSVNVHKTLEDLNGDPMWKQALPELLPDITGLLEETLMLMKELDGASDKSDRSHWYRPSIDENGENRHHKDWTALIALARDAWVAVHENDPEQAGEIARMWMKIPFPVFKRLAFFAIAQMVKRYVDPE